MINNNKKQKGDSAPSDSKPLNDSSYLFRWNYNEQIEFEKKTKRRKRRSGAFTYAIVMALVFLLCFTILIGTLIWYGNRDIVEQTPLDGLSTADIADMIKPATVMIYTESEVSYGYGTGFFIDARGYIATNYHILKDATHCSVTLYSGQVLDAQIIGYSEPDDLAVIKIKGDQYPVVRIGDTRDLREGDTAIAVGHPSGVDAPWSTTQGVISSLNRTITVTSDTYIAEMTMIQTDAALNPGNSGGPLCNQYGEVIGIVTRKLNDTEGISFAIPINGAMQILDSIVENGNADRVQSTITRVRPRVGIKGATIKKGDSFVYMTKNYTAEKDGVLISQVEENGAAANRLFVCDIIIAFDGRPVSDMQSFTEALYQYKMGEPALITVWRDGQEVSVSFTFEFSK